MNTTAMHLVIRCAHFNFTDELKPFFGRFYLRCGAL